MKKYFLGSIPISQHTLRYFFLKIKKQFLANLKSTKNCNQLNKKDKKRKYTNLKFKLKNIKKL